MSASVTNSESDIESIKERLSASLSEINGSLTPTPRLTLESSGLQTEIEEIKSRLLESYRQRGALQVDEIRAKADRDRLVLVVTEGRRELARLAGDSIEPSPLVSFGYSFLTAMHSSSRFLIKLLNRLRTVCAIPDQDQMNHPA